EAGVDTMRVRAEVDDYLRCPGTEDICVLGDNSLGFNEEGRPYLLSAQIAMQQGVACAHNLTASIRKQSLTRSEFSNEGMVASLGKGEAIGLAFGKKYTGRKAA